MSIQGERIRILRERVEMTQEEMALKLTTTQTQITRWETGKRQPTAETLRKIARLFDSSSSYINGEIERSGPLTSEQEAVLIAFDSGDTKAVLDIFAKKLRKHRKRGKSVPGIKP